MAAESLNVGYETSRGWQSSYGCYKLVGMSQDADSLTHDIRVTRIGEDGLLFLFTPAEAQRVALPIQRKLWQLAYWLEPQRESLGLIEIVPGMGNLLLRASRKTLLNTLRDLVVTHWPQLSDEDVQGRRIEIPVSYGGAHGPDLEAAAAHCGISPERLVALHSAAIYRVYCLGFQPGFAYLGGLDPALEVPRLATPRLSVPAGSVAIAGSQTAVYPSSSPGGWHIIGHTETRLFDPNSELAALLRPGDSVRFVAQEESK